MVKSNVLYAAWCAGRPDSGYNKNTARHFGFSRYWTSRGCNIDWQHKAHSKQQWRKLFNENNYKHVLLFNGNHSSMDVVRNLAHERNIGITVFEGGFYVARTFVLDRVGYGPHSTLCNDSFSWVDAALLDEFQVFKEAYIKNLTPKSSDYIIVPLQVEHDPTLKLYSNCDGRSISTMREWVEFIDTKFDGHKILYKSHPLHKNSFKLFRDLRKYTKHKITDPSTDTSYRSFMSFCGGAYMCLGIHSHAMAQSMILDITTYAHAKCPMWRIRDGGKDKKKLNQFLAACYHNTVPIFDLEKTEAWYARNYPNTV